MQNIMQMEFQNVLALSAHLKSISHLLTNIRSTDVGSKDFRHYSNRLMNILCEEALALKCDDVTVETPTGMKYEGKVNTCSNKLIRVFKLHYC